MMNNHSWQIIFCILVVIFLANVSYSEENSPTDGIRKSGTNSLITILCNEDFVKCVGLDSSHCAAAIDNSFKFCWEKAELAECVMEKIQNDTGIDLSVYQKCKWPETLERE